MTDDGQGDGEDDEAKPKATSLQKSQPVDTSVQQLLDATKDAAEGLTVDVNVLLVQVIQKASNPDDLIATADKILRLTKDFETARTENFTKRANAIIDAKERDPDEIEKRRNNAARRGLKVVVALATFASLIGGVVCTIVAANIVLAGMLLLTGAFGLAMLAPLASGESVSTDEVIGLMHAAKELRPSSQNKSDSPPSKKKRKR